MVNSFRSIYAKTDRGAGGDTYTHKKARHLDTLTHTHTHTTRDINYRLSLFLPTLSLKKQSNSPSTRGLVPLSFLASSLYSSSCLFSCWFSLSFFTNFLTIRHEAFSLFGLSVSVLFIPLSFLFSRSLLLSSLSLSRARVCLSCSPSLSIISLSFDPLSFVTES